MNTLKNLAVDLIAMTGIIILAFTGNEILKIIVWIYTALLLIGKIAALFMPYLQQKAKGSEASEWIYHMIYAITVFALVFSYFFYLSGIWVLIWLISIYINFSRNKKVMAGP